AQLQDPVHVAGDLVDFEIDARPGRESPERGHFHRMRDEVDGDDRPVGFVANPVDRQADAVHGDGALVGEEARELAGHPDLEETGFPDRLEAHHFADAVDMAGHEMAAEPIGQGHRLLEIDLAGRIQADRKAEALARDIHIEAVVGQRDDRHAGALDGDRVADADVRKVERAGLDLQAHAAAAPDGLDLANAPYRGNDSGEHGYLVTGLSFGA